ncbi:MAG: hypothetical protein ACTSP9_05715 [Promethearchaeota archaeon]
MRTYKIVIIFIAALIVGGTIGFFTTGFVTSGSIGKQVSFNYDPSVPTPVESLKIQTDIGKINFQYNTSNLVHYATVDVDISISGLFMEGKDYTAFFVPDTEWWPLENEFYLKTLPDIWFDPSYWFKSYDITINVTLRTDIVYNLTAIARVGSIEMTTANGVVLNDLNLETSTGSVNFVSKENTEFLGGVDLTTTTGSLTISTLENSTFKSSLKLSTFTGSLDLFGDTSNFEQGIEIDVVTGSMDMNLTSCVLGDSLIGSVITGSIEIYTDDILYTQDCELNLMTTTGSITVDINQTNDMGANITSIIQTTTGSIDVIYKDYVVDVGAQFTSSKGIGSIDYIFLPAEFSHLSDVLTSVNYNEPYVNTYTFACTVNTGSINVDARSIV